MKQELIMNNISERRAIDLLVNEFWRLGFFTLSRRFGTYLPEPENIGKFSVDVVGRLREKYAVGITLKREDIFSSDLIEKINFLASRRTKFSDKAITLFIGVPDIYFQQVKEILLNVDEKIKKNIKLIRIIESDIDTKKEKRKNQQVIFS